jgi:Protein of unknown function (DUF3649)
VKAADATYRWAVLSRCVAAAFGGYAVVALLQLAMVAVLPWDNYKAMLFSSQTSYLYYTGLIIWCFAARTARRAWLGLVLVALPLVLIDAWYLMQRVSP